MELNRSLLAYIMSCRHWAVDPFSGLEMLAAAQLRAESNNPIPQAVNGRIGKDGIITYNTWDDMATGPIAYHELTGAMIYEDGPCSRGIQSWVRMFDEEDSNPDTKAHFVKVSSGGGQYSAGVAAYEAVKNSIKPVVAFVDTAASAAYMAIAGADEIILNGNMSSVGSIGVMVTMSNELLDMLKTKYTTLYSRDSPDKNKEFRAMLSGDTTPMVDWITSIDQNFMNLVKENRGLRSGRVLDRETMAGGMFEGKDAKARGLVDAIGDRYFALKRVFRYL